MKSIIQFTKSFFDAFSEGIIKLGDSVQKTGLITHIFAFWCIGWGVIGFVYSFFYLISKIYGTF